ncbi:MAG TPA: M23 family metallopeptidase [bacterium]|nr:M23 family metallopeptidase [bacterium]
MFVHLRNGFSLIIAPHGTGAPVTFNLPAQAAMLLFVLVIVFVVGLGFVGITYTKMAILALQASKLRSENQVLRAQNEKVKEIEFELARIEKLKKQIGAWAGIMDTKGHLAGMVGDQIPATNFWPRRYTYGIMEPFYTGFASPAGGMILPANGWVSKAFAGDAAAKGGHPGIDIVAPRGTPVRCALDGVVKSAGWDDTYGNLVVVDHGDTLTTLYGHNERLLVKAGDHVARGQIIAVVGSTGRSTAPHVHFEILKGNKPVDPGDYIDLTKS